MKILFISGREPAYVRNAMLLKGLQTHGVEILDCTDSSASYLTRYVAVLRKFIPRRKMDFNFIFVGFFGQPLVPVIKKLTNKPIIFDAFLSGYDTMCFDRKRFRPDSLAGKFFYWLDKHSCERSDKIVCDTNAHIEYFVKTFGIRKDKFRRILAGADESLFYPREVKRESNKFRVFYYSTFLPLHGTEHIIHAAKILEQNRDLEFEIVGNGPLQKKIRGLARSLAVKNITFIDWMPYRELPLKIAQADVCLGGHFSDGGKAKRVIAGKTYQFIAMKKPVLVGDCPGNRELFTHRENALLVTMADPGSLAAAILELWSDKSLRDRIAAAGYNTFREKCDTAAIGAELKRALDALEAEASEPKASGSR